MSPKRHFPVLATVVVLVLTLVSWTEGREGVPKRYHAHAGARAVGDSIQGLPVQHGPYFVTSGRCAGCHGYDSLGMAMVDLDGNSVNVTDDWRSTMMANSARDPFFRAKLEHEALVNPTHAGALENSCLRCHAPQGAHQEAMLGHPPFTAAMLDTSIMGMDGVGCLSCHMQNPDAAGTRFSGDLLFDSARVYGPYPDSVINPAIMEFFVQFVPGQGEHILDGRACAGCHTLITHTVDLQGEPTGGIFVEQATWHEWLNSDYPAMGVNCRSCHMPRINDPVVLASEYLFLPAHSPFGKHYLVGGNAFMIRMFRSNRELLGIPASERQLDSTIARTERLLRSAVEVGISSPGTVMDSLVVHVELRNRSGHKFPSGYPSRRAFIQVLAITATGDTLFNNGSWDATWELHGHDPGYEPHHNVVTRNDQVQIYEMVMGDVNGNVTTILERAAAPLKDNRLPPAGFTTTHASYDTMRVVGIPHSDTDFNLQAGVEGSGKDVVEYRIDLNGHTGPVRVESRLYYQPVPPGWNAEMFSMQGPRIDAFRDMYHAQDGSPDLVHGDTLYHAGTGSQQATIARPLVYPNPTVDGTVRITGAEHADITVFDAAGKRVPMDFVRQGPLREGRLPPSAGTYFIRISGPMGNHVLRVVRTRP